jgi:membrane protease YdiL (CAAX protease family)
MIFMRLQKILGFSAALALATAVVAGLSSIHDGAGTATVAWQMVSRFVVVQVYGFFGLFMAQDSGIEGSLLIGNREWSDKVRGIVNWGILPGLVIGVINYLFFFAYRYSPFVIPRIREMKSGYDAFIISMESGITEESIYRLFILSSMLYLFRRLYSKLKPVWPAAAEFLPSTLALVLSSMVFGLAHSYYGFTAAFFGGMVLGVIYLRSGIESSIAAHFAANFLFFTASYLV